MRKSYLIWTVAALAVSIAAGAPLAVASSSEKAPIPHRLKKNAAQRSGANGDGGLWFMAPRSGKGGIRIFRYGEDDYTPRKAQRAKRKAVVADSGGDYDPEPIPGLGWGNPVYVAPVVVPLADPAIAKTASSDAQNLQLVAVLADPRSGIRVEQPLRAPILELYKSNGFKPLWLDGSKPSERATKLLAFAASVESEGLTPQDYLPAMLTSFDGVETQLQSDPAKLAAFDVALTAVSVKLAQHLSGGKFEANRLSLYNDLPSQRVEPATALKVLAHSPFPDAYLAGLSPTIPAYGLMKAELKRLREGGETPQEPVIAEGKTVKPGASDPRIIMLRDRMVKLGFLDSVTADVGPEAQSELDADLSNALRAYQKSVKVKANGRLDNTTIAKLNAKPASDDKQRLIVNMERVRWLPRQLADRHVFVNQPAFEVRVLDKGKQVWRSNVIIGRQTTQTASFYDEMETVVFNPSWGMPQSILVNEYLGKLRRDPGYFDRIGYKVINQKGKVVSSRSIRWGSYSVNSPVGVQQPPGSGNALGELKFLFPNEHSIYMHDTPTRHLFAESVRAFSHGCVRVENPREFASVLLGWDRAKVDEMTDSGVSETVKLDGKVAVYLTYFTAWPDQDGKIRYYDDIYQRDATMERAMTASQPKQTADISGDLVQN